MILQRTQLRGAVIIEPRVFEDDRGFFMETYQKRRFAEAGLPNEFVQENYSHSVQRVLRGLHYQIDNPQGKLVRAVYGRVFDVAVDLRCDSATFGKWTAVELSGENRRMFYIPPGFAHGFCVLSEVAGTLYSCTDYYHPEHERTILWNDPDLGIDWPIKLPLLSEKDQRGMPLSEAPCYDSETATRHACHAKR